MDIRSGFKIVRERHGVNVGDIAKSLHTTRSAIYISMGKNGDPKLSTILKICNVIGCSVEELIRESENIKEG